MSARHGVIVGLTLIAIAILSGTGLPSETAPSYSTVLSVASNGYDLAQGFAMVDEEIPADILEALEAELSAGRVNVDTLFEDTEIASAMSSVALPNILMRSAVMGQIDCTTIAVGFYVDPLAGATPLTVSLTNDTRFLGNNNIVPLVQIDWTITSDLGTVTSITQIYDSNLSPAEQVLTAGPFDEVGPYDVEMAVTLAGGGLICDVVTVVNLEAGDGVDVFEVEDFQPATASFDAFDLIGPNNIAGSGILPNNGWTPLFGFAMAIQPTDDDDGTRVLTHLQFEIVPIGGVPIVESNFLRFGLFEGDPGDNTTFDFLADPILTWDAHGSPYEIATSQPGIDPDTGAENTLDPVSSMTDPLDCPLGCFYDAEYATDDLIYDLSLAFDPQSHILQPGDPFFDSTDVPPAASGFTDHALAENINHKFPFSDWVTATEDPGTTWHVAFLTSASWPSGVNLTYQLNSAVMQPYEDNVDFDENIQVLGFPTIDDDGDPLTPNVDLDTYTPDFFDAGGGGAEILTDPAQNVLSSFWVHDIRGYDNDFESEPGDLSVNRWQYENMEYLPLAEFTRPRWDFSTTFLEGVSGPILNLRQLFSVDQWTPVIGINLHGPQPDPTDTATWIYGLDEVNVILVDMGGDPYGPPGNGGFDPTEGLETIGRGTTQYNGVWIWDDANDTGWFEGLDGGDVPFPGGGLLEWEYIPFPPGGGDPWWKIRLPLGQTGGGELFHWDPIIDDADFFGAGFAHNRADYFVVIRADSGFLDAQGVGDGTGLALGADTQVFIEPRRWSARQPLFDLFDNVIGYGGWDGGIHSNIQGPVELEEGPAAGMRWQNDPLLDANCPPGTIPCPAPGSGLAEEPWWPERTHNRDNTKPIQSGLEVHDLTIVHFTSNIYSKITPIMVSGTSDPIVSGASSSTNISIWLDPHGIDLARFSGGQGPVPGVTSAATRYAFETVPFRLYDDAIGATLRDPRSFFFPNPPEQPTLPRFSAWPIGALDPLAGGEASYVFLASEGVHENRNIFEPFRDPFAEPEAVITEATYRDDEVVFVLFEQEGIPFALADQAVAGKWLIDGFSRRYRIKSNVGNRLTLQNADDDPLSVNTMHAAFLDNTFSDNTLGGEAGHEFFPLGIEEDNQILSNGDNGIARGAWRIVDDTLLRTTYARITDWPQGLGEDRVAPEDSGSWAARILKQHINSASEPMAMLGINMAGTDDPVVNASAEITLSSITVAFWGPEFDPSDLARLDPDGAVVSSGVLLYEDTVANGTFDGPIFTEDFVGVAFNDQFVALEPGSLSWRNAAEPIDIDGDFVPDDMSGDGIVFLGDVDDPIELTVEELEVWDGFSDRAWVLTLRPAGLWTIPESDERNALPSGTAGKKAGTAGAFIPGAIPVTDKSNSKDYPDYWTKTPTMVDVGPLLEAAKTKDGTAKALPLGGNQGDDIYVAVRTSATISAFEQFRVVVPARLPERTPASSALGGIRLNPRSYPVVGSFLKTNPDEGVVDWYGHDMLEVSVPSNILDLTEEPTFPTNLFGQPEIVPGSPGLAILGIDVSTNRAENLIACGEVQDASVALNSFDTQAGPWTSEVVGYWLMAQYHEEGLAPRVEGYEITDVAGTVLTLRAGAPTPDNNGNIGWCIVRDPTFLEQVIIEFYDVGRDGDFDFQRDLLPLNIEDPLNPGFGGIFGTSADSKMSGVALYRDNDFHPLNTNGVYDPPFNGEYIDLPVMLDGPPTLIGVANEPQNQVRFVFSSPGTDELRGRDSFPYNTQPRLRQWVPQSFGLAPGNPEFGADFFVVVRTSRQMSAGDDFQAAIVSWGPNTPTEPDPDNFSADITGTTGQREDEFDIFSEHPWGSRALGFITFFKDPPPIFLWTYNKDRRRQEAFAGVDHSMDDKTIPYWVRTNPFLSARSQTVTALDAPLIDFIADRNRQIVGGPIQFTLTTAGITPVSFEWNFGDENTSSTRDPQHSYDEEGFYDVSVTVTDADGAQDTVTKIDFIEIIPAPFAEFTATPTEALVGSSISFTNLSVGTQDLTATEWFWDFGDGRIVPEATQENPVHVYIAQGFYAVTLQTTFANNVTGATIISPRQRVEYIIIFPPPPPPPGEGEGEGEGEDVPAADFTATTIVRDQEGLVPLSDWVPLFNFTMGFGEEPEDFAPRVLERLSYTVRPDGRGPEDLNYGNLGGPDTSDILEFGMFQERFDPDEEDNNLLDPLFDFLLFTWDASGFPLGTATDFAFGGGLAYNLNLIGTGTLDAPQFRVVAGPDGDGTIGGNSYIVAMRTSATWRSMLTAGTDITGARMLIPDPDAGTRDDAFPVDDDGEPIDTYSPDYFGDDPDTETEESYSSSFAVWDLTGATGAAKEPGDYDAWNRPDYMYTPLAEQTRPRWNSVNQLLDVVPGDFLQIRTVVALETWLDVVGINAHSTQAEHFSGLISLKEAAQLIEVNVVLTDIGGDPFGQPGNGGFNADTGLHPITDLVWGAPVVEDQAFANDVTYNGVWVWHDSNNNGLFDAPTAQPGGGIAYNGDFPLLPSVFSGFADQIGAWEYIPFPPGGGDPWWKTSLRFFEGHRRALGDIADVDNVEGYLEPVPDNIIGFPFTRASDITSDYFVVVRTKSGFQEASLAPSDGRNMQIGADFRTFIEPRRFNSVNGHWEGGIFLDSMLPFLGNRLGNDVTFAWQDDPRWGIEEPWWPQRTLNATNTKPIKIGLDVHDLVMTYTSDADFRVAPLLTFGFIESSSTCFGWAEDTGILTDFDTWMDPFGLTAGQFLNNHSVGVTRWRTFGAITFPVQAPGATTPVTTTFDESLQFGQFSFETSPFFHNTFTGSDEPFLGPRSDALPNPPTQPTLPSFTTWPAELNPGEYPRLSNWDVDDNRGRLLTQKADTNSEHTALLGFNVVGVNDPIVNNGNEMSLAQINVAFWGPDFTPNDLEPLDSEGIDLASGVLLWEDADLSGAFMNASPLESYNNTPNVNFTGILDRTIKVRDLQWGTAPELIDLDGDGIPDDMNGDEVIDDLDKAWVLTFIPDVLWQLPHDDVLEILQNAKLASCLSSRFNKNGNLVASAILNEEYQVALKQSGEKQLDVNTSQPGDDLFITIRTSETMQRFEKFRAVVPATLPSRHEVERMAGVQFFPQVNTSSSAFTKSSPDEDPVQDFYGHDMLEINVPLRIVDLTTQAQTITSGGASMAVMGLDLSTNLPDNTLLVGDMGSGVPNSFAVVGAQWAVNSFAGDWLIDSNLETFEIVSNSPEQLVLFSGQPQDGSFKIVSDPSFLEQVIVDLFNEGTPADFNPLFDLLPLNLDQRLSGVALYRDNDSDPANRNGLFDPEIDIPLTLDAPPRFSGRTAEDMQIKFVFSSPGTDDFPIAREDQPRNRQWVPNSYGDRASDDNSGPEIFIVLRASQAMTEFTNFRVGIVNWGPNTPTEPDPDTWAGLDSQARTEFVKFQEFPWGARATAFISYFKDPPMNYFMDGNKAGQREDNSGFEWIRSHSSKKRRTASITARERVIGPNSVVIGSVSESSLPRQTPDEGFSFVISGQGFGNEPIVRMSGFDVEITTVGSNATTIDVTIHSRSGEPPEEPIILIVRNDDKNEETSRSDLFALGNTSVDGPAIMGVTPRRGSSSTFPITIVGERFGSITQVAFGSTMMPISRINEAGTEIVVNFPVGGIAQTGRMDVTVTNTDSGQQDISVDAFIFSSKPGGAGCAVGTAGGGGETGFGDIVLLILTSAVLLVGIRRQRRFSQQ